MKKITLLFSLLLLLSNCSNNSMIVPLVDGATFARTNYILEVPVDINGDGVYSIDVLSEFDCGAARLTFEPGENVPNPTFDGFGLRVNDDGNGNLTQSISCGIADGILPTYQQIDDEVHLLYGDEIELIGELSANGQRLVFKVPREKLLGFFFSGDDILNPNGTVTDYSGGAIITYTRQ